MLCLFMDDKIGTEKIVCYPVTLIPMPLYDESID